MKNKKKYYTLILYLIFVLVFFNFPLAGIFNFKFLPDDIEKAKAAEVTIDSNVSTSDAGWQRSPNVVFLDDVEGTGYSFGIDSDGTCVYWKTTDGGRTWGSAVVLTSQTDCLGTTVWYDRWTPGDTTGTYIHIVFAESGGDDLYYERLDTSDDSQLGETDATSQSATLAETNSISITVGTDGDIYMGTADADDSYVVKCTTTCGTAGNWSEAGTNPMDTDEDELILRPLASADILLINWDISDATNAIVSWEFDDSAGTWDGAGYIIGSANDHTSYKHNFDATVNLSNNDIYLAVTNDIGRPVTDIDTYTYSSGSWTTNTDAIVDTKVTGVAIGFNENSNAIIVSYTVIAATANYNVRSITSTDYMTSWASDIAVSVTQDNHISLSMNMTGNVLYTIWKNTDLEDLLGAPPTMNLIQTSYRFENDNSAPNSNTAMANADTAVTGIEIGQRLTARIQLENPGSNGTTTAYILQFTTDDPFGTPSWTDVGAATAISYAWGSATNGDAITATVCTASSQTWANGTWHEAQPSTAAFSFVRNRYTDFGFMIETSNAANNTTYYLRLLNKTSNRALNAYVVFPTLTTGPMTKRYSKEDRATLRTNTDDLAYYLDELGYTYVDSPDNDRDPMTAGSEDYVVAMFVQRNSNSTDQIDISWEGQSSLACGTATISLEVYNFTDLGWEPRQTNTICSADTDFTITDTISTSISEYYSSNLTYWRVQQANAASAKTLRTDDITFTFSAAGSLTMSAPSTVDFDAFSLPDTTPNKDTWATGTEQILVSNSLSAGWTLSATCTDFETIEDPMQTIINDSLVFDSDAVTSTDPTIVFTTWFGNIAVTEGSDGQSFADPGTPVTIATAAASEGVGNFYIQPSLDLHVYNTSTFTGTYNATLTLTLAFNDEYKTLFRFIKNKISDFFRTMV